MVELALVMPLFVMVVIGIVTLGIGVFYQQQVTNGAREAARYAAIHTATAQCPTVSRKDPGALPQTYYRCDAPENNWPYMTAAARQYVFALPPGDVRFSACWSGYVQGSGSWDAPPKDQGTGTANPFAPCTIGGIDPRTNPSSIPCPPPATSASDDTASSMSASYGDMANQVTAYACYRWSPPLAGFLLIPDVVTLRAVVTEELQYQQ